jgi:hypothetical protein
MLSDQEVRQSLEPIFESVFHGLSTKGQCAVEISGLAQIIRAMLPLTMLLYRPRDGDTAPSASRATPRATDQTLYGACSNSSTYDSAQLLSACKQALTSDV